MQRLENTRVRKINPGHQTVIKRKNTQIGGGNFTVIAGPCALENAEQALQTAHAVQQAGAKIFRCSIFKPRTSPYSFQGMGPEGIDILRLIRRETGLLLETEILAPGHFERLYEHVDFFRIGSRNMDNYELLKEAGHYDRPVILKRNMSATLEEFLLAAEYILANGNPEVILCERGIRTFETYTRNTLDILAVPALKELTHLPVIVDPSHSAGRRSLVAAASRAAVAAGADGLMIEVHPNPDKALSDGVQSLNLPQFAELMQSLQQIAPVVGKQMD